MLIVFDPGYFSLDANRFVFAWTSSDGQPLPFDRCASGCHTSDIGNGNCDLECYNHACSWDSGDCAHACNMTTSCMFDDISDGTCDERCMNAGCSYDAQECGCKNRIDEPYGFLTDGSGNQEDYTNDVTQCWVLHTNAVGSPARGPQLALTFARFDVENFFDYLEIFDGADITAPRLSPGGTAHGFSGLTPRGPALTRMARNSTGDTVLVRFHTDATVTEAGYLLGWTSLPLPQDGVHCALDCALTQRGDGHCDRPCMNAFCDFDRGDCAPSFECAAGCATHLIGNGICERACLVADCNWDARDCECEQVLEEESGFRVVGSSAASTNAPSPQSLVAGSEFYTYGQGWTGGYQASQHACWLIRPKRPNITSLRLSFARFSTEHGFDVLRVYDGRHIGAPELYPGGLSGTRAHVNPVQSSGSEVLLIFRSDDMVELTGFLFGWTPSVSSTNSLHNDECARRCPLRLKGNGLCDPPWCVASRNSKSGTAPTCPRYSSH